MFSSRYWYFGYVSRAIIIFLGGIWYVLRRWKRRFFLSFYSWNSSNVLRDIGICAIIIFVGGI